MAALRSSAFGSISVSALLLAVLVGVVVSFASTQPSALFVSGFVVVTSQSLTTIKKTTASSSMNAQPTNGDNDDDKKRLPKLIVLDLDNTIWTPELYQLRQHQRSGQIPVAGKDVTLMSGAQALIHQMRTGAFADIQFAVASRTKSGSWAQDLLDQFQLRELLDYVEIFPGNKRAHFENLQQSSGIAFEDMLFFDDARDGKYGNCEPVSAMGVLSVHCPTGLDTYEVFERALKRYQEWDKSPNTIVEWDGTVTNPKTLANQRQRGTVKMVNLEKRFGFIKYGTNKKGKKGSDIFFHFSNLPEGVTSVEEGDPIEFTIQKDPKNGKYRAANIHIITLNDSSSSDKISLRAFSMNMPFAALLANGYKTLESRNGTMFQQYPEGTHMLLHVGRRIYPDGNKHLEILQDAGLSDEEIAELKSFPPSFGKGMLVAVMELGQTYETTVPQRSTPEMQRSICAYGADSGRIVTEIKKIAYLKQPVPMAAQGGVFKVQIDPGVLPEDWTLPEGTVPPQAYKVASTSSEKNDGSSAGEASNSASGDTGSSQQPIYSISG